MVWDHKTILWAGHMFQLERLPYIWTVIEVQVDEPAHLLQTFLSLPDIAVFKNVFLKWFCDPKPYSSKYFIIQPISHPLG